MSEGLSETFVQRQIGIFLASSTSISRLYCSAQEGQLCFCAMSRQQACVRAVGWRPGGEQTRVVVA